MIFKSSGILHFAHAECITGRLYCRLIAPVRKKKRMQFALFDNNFSSLIMNQQAIASNLYQLALSRRNIYEK